MASNPINVSTSQANAFAAAYKAGAPAPAASAAPASSGGGSSAAPAAPVGVSSGIGGYSAPVDNSAPATAPAASAAPSTGVSSSQTNQNNPANSAYYPRQISGASDPAFAAAVGNATPATTAPTADDFFSKVYAQLQPVIDAIGLNEASAEASANAAARKAESSMNAGLNSRGMAGSSEATAGQAQVDQARSDAILAAKAKQATDTANLVQWAIPEAQSEFKDALTRYDQQSKDYVTAQQTKAQNTVASLAKNGVSLDDVKAAHPDEYNQLVQYFNGDENLMRATYIGSIPAASMIGDPIYNGSKATFLYVDPITHQYKSSTIDTGTNLDASNTTVTSVTGVGVVVFDKATGEGHIIGGTQNPYYAAGQQSLLDTRKAMLTSRYGTAVNNVIKQLYPTATSNPMNLYSNSLNYTTKLNTAYAASSDPKNANKGASDLELADAAIKINNGGQQITEAQFNAFNESLGALGAAKLSYAKFKAAANGGDLLLTQGQRDSIHKLAEENVKAQQDNAVAATKVIADRAVRAGVPSQYLSTPDDILSLSAASNPSADATGASAGDVIQYNGANYVVGDDGSLTPQ